MPPRRRDGVCTDGCRASNRALAATIGADHRDRQSANLAANFTGISAAISAARFADERDDGANGPHRRARRQAGDAVCDTAIARAGVRERARAGVRERDSAGVRERDSARFGDGCRGVRRRTVRIAVCRRRGAGDAARVGSKFATMAGMGDGRLGCAIVPSGK